MKYFKYLFYVLLIIGSIFIWEKIKGLTPFGKAKSITSHNIIVEKISKMGKLELVRYNFKDIVEQKLVQDFLPDPKAILIIQGEAVGCIDLQKIQKSDIILKADTLIIKLPKPEVCYYKIDHSKSKVYDTEYAFMNEGLLLEEAYKKAEENVLKTALATGILEQTQRNATLILKPMLENMSQKSVVLKFDLEANLPKLK